jgi:16S rRNA (guanine966-N2)-methyltransferase
MAKEALINILNNKIDIEESKVLDLFSGTGNISFEFASRDAIEVISVEQNIKCVNFIKDFALKLKLDNLQSIKSDAIKYLSRCSQRFDLIYADPPYIFDGYEKIIETVFENQLLEDGGILILEHSKVNTFSENSYFDSERKYGHVHFSFFKNQ